MLRYADEAELIAGSENELQLILDTFTEESGKRGLELNIKKTECMAVSKKGQMPTCNISCKGKNINQTYLSKYLGFLIMSDARCDTEIQKRIAIAKNTFNKMSPILKNETSP
ncbi:endonuclease-reverse transcriptase [Plakobranchus ocellatus]|uniref:Endonuclease-reverse transcriptase n=1 Tax=Plakobranchus ocellatus TaxID=259542 RepID=A0AAV3YU99_9GAST|nr:endonuclease-reverse transcriptase [Plakobranchus ocellatus]